MPTLLIALALVLGLVAAAGWSFFAIRSLRRAIHGTAKGPAPTLMAEISLVADVVVLLRGGSLFTPFVMALPPLALVTVPSPWDFAYIMGRAALVAVPIAAVAYALCRRRFEQGIFSVVIPAAIALAVGIIVAERISQRAMCNTAAALGLTDIMRHTVLWSLANAPVEFQFDIHGLARNGPDHFGWSYATMDWYTLPDSVWNNVESGSPTCT